jgi:hypothetical protein
MSREYRALLHWTASTTMVREMARTRMLDVVAVRSSSRRALPL